MYFIPYNWKEGELDKYLNPLQMRNNCDQTIENSANYTRFGGVLLPFIGGLLIGGLFMPRPNNQQYPYPQYYSQPMYYYPNQPYYQTYPQSN